jgi:sigma-B regulation protein RsbU (phosphoserine phosphatase)
MNANNTTFGQGRVLVVDDNEMNRDMLSRRLSRRGLTVTTAEDGYRALDLIRTQPYDLVMLDVMMPGIDGLDVLKTIRETSSASDLPVIMATARTQSDEIVQALKLGANDYVTKPLDFGVVLARVQTHLSLKAAREQLKTAHECMKRDVEAAASVQRALLPVGPPTTAGASFAWRHEACELLAGDSLNVFALDDHHVCMYVLDVSGHGVCSSLLSVSVTHSLTLREDRSSLIKTGEDTLAGPGIASPGDVAGRLNVIYPMSATGRVGLYFTLAYAVLDVRQRRLHFTCAGHPGPIVVRRDGPAEFADVRNLPIGMFPVETFEEATLDLDPGDRVYFYSDGLYEVPNPVGDIWGRERLREFLERSGGLSLDESLDAALREAVSWQGQEHFDDDVSLLAVEISPVGEHIGRSTQ